MSKKKYIKELEETGIIDVIGDAISIQDTDFKILYQNNRLKDIVGDRVGEYCYKAYQGEDQVCEGCHLAMAFKDGQIHTVERTRISSEGIMYSENTASVLKDPNGKIVVGIEVVRDITKRKRMNTQLIQYANDWRDTFNNITDMITIHDLDFNIVFANSAAKKILRLPLLEGGIKKHKCFKYYHGTECARDGCPRDRCLKTGKPASFDIYEPYLKMFIEIRLMPRFDADNQIVGLIHIARDITERKRLQKKIIQDRDHLEKHVKERTAELEKTAKTLLSEINQRKQTEENLRFTEKELIASLKELKEANTALKVLLKQSERNEIEFKNNISANIKHLVIPYISKLKKNRAMSEELTYLNIIESNINEIVSPFSSYLSSKYLSFTPKEIQVANLVKDGKQDKDIMEVLNISLETIKTHRKNIRKKLGIYGKRINLRAYLLADDDE